MGCEKTRIYSHARSVVQLLCRSPGELVEFGQIVGVHAGNMCSQGVNFIGIRSQQLNHVAIISRPAGGQLEHNQPGEIDIAQTARTLAPIC